MLDPGSNGVKLLAHHVLPGVVSTSHEVSSIEVHPVVSDNDGQEVALCAMVNLNFCSDGVRGDLKIDLTGLGPLPPQNPGNNINLKIMSSFHKKNHSYAINVQYK